MSSLSTKRPSQSEDFKSKLIQDVQGEGADFARLNFEIEKNLARQLKVKCAEQGRTMSNVVRELIITYLSK